MYISCRKTRHYREINTGFWVQHAVLPDTLLFLFFYQVDKFGSSFRLCSGQKQVVPYIKDHLKHKRACGSDFRHNTEWCKIPLTVIRSPFFLHGTMQSVRAELCLLSNILDKD